MCLVFEVFKTCRVDQVFRFCGTIHLRNNLHFLGPGVVAPQNADDCEFGVPWLDCVHLQFNYRSYVVVQLLNVSDEARPGFDQSEKQIGWPFELHMCAPAHNLDFSSDNSFG